MTDSSTATKSAPTSPFSTRTTCRLCGGQWLVPFLDLGALCLSDFVYPSEPDPPAVPLRLAICSACNLVQLMETTTPDLLYRKFWYRSGTNRTMVNEMRRLARLGTELGEAGPNRVWVDIGANDGTLLAAAPAGTFRVAFEPALNLRQQLLLNADLVHSTYFKAGISPPADVLFTAAMFYDLDDPVNFAAEVRQALKPHGLWINQLSYTPTMVALTAFDNVCHEHLTYYTLETLEAVYHRAGLKVLDVTLNDINGGSFCVLATHLDDPRNETSRVETLRVREKETEAGIGQYTRFARKVRSWKFQAGHLLDQYARDGQAVHLYGASTKGNTLLQYLGATPSWFDCAAERNPEKVGRVTVGSRIPIVSEEESRERRPAAYFVLPWAFREEFVDREHEFLKAGGKLIFPLPSLETVSG